MRIINLDQLTAEENKEFNAIALEIRPKYNDLIESVSADHVNNIHWIVGSVASRNKYQSPLFYRCCQLVLIQKILERKEEISEVTLSDRPMNRLQYRNMGDHEAMVVCQTVNAGSGRAGMRWWELQKTFGNWSIYQEGTYAPADGLNRWMGSIALDQNGNIALGYSASASTIYPDIRFTGRFASDPLGVMTIAETVIHAGNGSQTGGLSRWGDYTQMSADPTDVGTFWYTNQYIPSNGSFNWKTRIAAFNFDLPCPIGYASNPSPADNATGI